MRFLIFAPLLSFLSYEVWSFEVKCLQKLDYLPDHLLLQAIRNHLKGTARSMRVPLGESASVKDILFKLDVFIGMLVPVKL